MKSLLNTLNKLSYRPLALMPEAYATLANNIETLGEIDFSALLEDKPIYERAGKVGIINIEGILNPTAGKIEKILGFAGCADIRKAIKQAAADDSEVIILNINSPGGSTASISETGKAIQKLKESKHVIAYSSDLMASSAYWLGGQADEIIISESACVGCIGVYISFLTYGKNLEAQGITPVIVQKGRLKTLGMGAKDVTPDEFEYMENAVSKDYENFKAAIAHRGLDESVLQGQSFYGSDAIENKLADGIEDDLENLIAYLNL